MKRLTIRNSDGSVSQPTDLKWGEALERLAMYEDMQENHYFDIENELFFCEVMDKVKPDRFMEIMNAELDGRLVVLQCKVGDTVWDRKAEPWTVVSIEWFSRKVTQLHCKSPVTGTGNTFSVGKRSIGKTVFLTREEVEAAVEAKRNE